MRRYIRGLGVALALNLVAILGLTHGDALGAAGTWYGNVVGGTVSATSVSVANGVSALSVNVTNAISAATGTFGSVTAGSVQSSVLTSTGSVNFNGGTLTKNGTTMLVVPTGMTGGGYIANAANTAPNLQWDDLGNFTTRGSTTALGQMLALGGSPNALTNGAGFLRVGGEGGQNVIADYAGIQARNNGAASTLALNPNGGAVTTGGALAVGGAVSSGAITATAKVTGAGFNDSAGTASTCVGTDGSKNFAYGSNCAKSIASSGNSIVVTQSGGAYNVEVNTSGASSPPIIRTHSGAGTFSLPTLPSGTWALTAQFTGPAANTISFSGAGGDAAWNAGGGYTLGASTPLADMHFGVGTGGSAPSFTISCSNGCNEVFTAYWTGP